MEEIMILKRELKNIRKEMAELKRINKRDYFLMEEKLKQWQSYDVNKVCNNQTQIFSEIQMETWQFNLQPIGNVSSVFHRKNGTPRQPVICSNSPASITINRNVFTNPEHALEGLEEFSHVWIIFIFHKNSSAVRKAKVKPPRLQGRKMGIFATRSPHRPNPIGLSLAKIEKIEGSTIFLSGVDMVDGTPVLDIKPYIPDYDRPINSKIIQDKDKHVVNCLSNGENYQLLEENPKNIIYDVEKDGFCIKNETYISKDDLSMDTIQSDGESICNNSDVNKNNQNCVLISAVKANLDLSTSDYENTDNKSKVKNLVLISNEYSERKNLLNQQESITKNHIASFSSRPSTHQQLTNMQSNQIQETQIHTDLISEDSASLVTAGNGETINIPSWLSAQPLSSLNVRFTPSAEQQLLQFHTNPSGDRKYFLSHLNTLQEVKSVIIQVLIGDPRSRYRKTKCIDKLFYFTVDSVHVTCWFDDRISLVEVVRLRPACYAPEPSC